MGNFRKVTICVLMVITGLFTLNVVSLHSLYKSVKSQYLATARECLVQADMLEILSRMKRNYEFDDSALEVNIRLDITHRMTENGSIVPLAASDSIGENKLLGFFESLHTTLTGNLRSAAEGKGGATDFEELDRLFMAELNRIGMHPRRVTVTPVGAPIPEDADGMWSFDYSLIKDAPVIYRAYISFPFSDILRQIIGVVSTTALIVVMLAFAFWYLIRTVMRMRSIEEMKDDFTNNMTHELKTPIAASYSAIDTLLNYGKHNDAGKRERYLRMALEQLTRLGELVEQILSMSMERRRTLALASERIMLKPFLEEIAAVHILHASKPVSIDVRVEPEDLTVESDPMHLGNVVNNLIDNAVKYSGSKVAIVMAADQAGLSVSDDGNGIPQRSLPHLFDKFYRVPSGNTQNVRGYGIGLFYVRTILEKMGWCIGVSSTLGKGSVFTIKFRKDEI